MSAVFIISAPSGSGKSTLVNEVRQIVSGLDFSVSYTTRAPRGSEQNGREYFFVSRPEFEEMISQDEFLEHAEVFGNYYGTARRFLHQAEANGHDLLLDIDVQGAEQIKHKLPQAVSVFILPPDRNTLEKRLRSRSRRDQARLQARLADLRPGRRHAARARGHGCGRRLHQPGAPHRRRGAAQAPGRRGVVPCLVTP